MSHLFPVFFPARHEATSCQTHFSLSLKLLRIWGRTFFVHVPLHEKHFLRMTG
ncbi:hypothetical protein BDR22DRAFT_871199 [Usnea florida]